MRKARRETDNEGDTAREGPIEIPSERADTEKTQEVRDEYVSPPGKPYKPLVPYPQRLAKAKEEHKYGKFLEILKKAPHQHSPLRGYY